MPITASPKQKYHDADPIPPKEQQPKQKSTHVLHEHTELLQENKRGTKFIRHSSGNLSRFGEN